MFLLFFVPSIIPNPIYYKSIFTILNTLPGWKLYGSGCGIPLNKQSYSLNITIVIIVMPNKIALFSKHDLKVINWKESKNYLTNWLLLKANQWKISF